jgi:anti-sigma factor ChrR (cupin superfamily)
MNDIFQCGDSAALVAYLYDECAPGEQALIAAHIRSCAACASEIDALNATRRTLAAWTPPELALGFRITREDQPRPAKILEPNIAWWRAPLPAWAQAAAALVIFGAGLSVGALRNTAPERAPATRTAPAVAIAAAPAAPSVSRDDLAQLEQRIKAELTQLRSSSTTATPVVARGSDDALIAQVKALIEQSEENQRREFTVRMVDLAGNIETQRRVDLASVRQQIGLQQGAIGTELRQQREVLGRLVSERTR